MKLYNPENYDCQSVFPHSNSHMFCLRERNVSGRRSQRIFFVSLRRFFYADKTFVFKVGKVSTNFAAAKNGQVGSNR